MMAILACIRHLRAVDFGLPKIWTTSPRPACAAHAQPHPSPPPGRPSHQVAAFIAKSDNFVSLVGDCYICMEPLLNNIGTTKFGVVSWRCRCTVPQKAHSACVFSKICHGRALCDMCQSPMEFEKTRRKGTQATIRCVPE